MQDANDEWWWSVKREGEKNLETAFSLDLMKNQKRNDSNYKTNKKENK